MNPLDAVILGIVEGITEYLPISSTGHMIVVSKWLGIAQNDTNKAFEVIIQLAAIVAVIANYREKFSFKYKGLWVNIAISFMPIAVLGLLLHEQVKSIFSVAVVAAMFIIGGLVFLIIEKRYVKNGAMLDDINCISGQQALLIGLAQAFSLIPGTSRAGASIVGALLLGISRTTSAEYSFLLALPVLLSAAALDLYQHYQDFNSNDLSLLGIGFLSAFITAFIAIKFFIGFLQRFTFVGFAIYRIVFGIILLGFI